MYIGFLTIFGVYLARSAKQFLQPKAQFMGNYLGRNDIRKLYGRQLSMRFCTTP